MKVHLADERLRVHAILACLPRNLPTNSTLTRAKSNEQTRVPSLFLRLALFPSPILRETPRNRRRFLPNRFSFFTWRGEKTLLIRFEEALKMMVKFRDDFPDCQFVQFLNALRIIRYNRHSKEIINTNRYCHRSSRVTPESPVILSQIGN